MDYSDVVVAWQSDGELTPEEIAEMPKELREICEMEDEWARECEEEKLWNDLDELW